MEWSLTGEPKLQLLNLKCIVFWRWKSSRDIESNKTMKRTHSFCLLYLVACTAGAAPAPAPEHWFMVQAPVSVSVDTASIEILPSGLRRARVKLDMSLAPPAATERAKRLMFDISVIVFNCKKKVSQTESGENHLADGTVVKWERSDPQDIWLGSDTDIALAYVCAWPGAQGREGNE